ncbi:hypothetical protein [Allokutzneria albata]|uniref:hypothetical protein n=1 Tax=Allokutzneria albata TaxID=211114 RepID=UPI00138E2199|nr:hypothetical protein [Allokutzneria albata]
MLDDEKRSTRLRSLLIPLFVTITVIMVIPPALVALVLYQVWPAALGGAGAAGAAGAGLVCWRRAKRRAATATHPPQEN